MNVNTLSHKKAMTKKKKNEYNFQLQKSTIYTLNYFYFSIYNHKFFFYILISINYF